jgi:phosphopantothenate-cysteine ligase
VKILVTSGGTTEKIDEVRKIKNTATGRLGALIAEEFSAQSNAEITYLCGEGAIIPQGNKLKIVKIESVSELTQTLTKLLTENKFDAVIHAMAVSDYMVQNVISAEDLAVAISEKLAEKVSEKLGEKIAEQNQSSNDFGSMVKIVHSAILDSNKGTNKNTNRKKISSDIDNLMVCMAKTPKVIQLIKELQKDTILVGFKLLVDVPENTLLKVGHNLLLKNNCDFVLANDLTKIQGDNHRGLLIKPDCPYQSYETKQEIASGIVENVLAKIGDKK